MRTTSPIPEHEPLFPAGGPSLRVHRGGAAEARGDEAATPRDGSDRPRPAEAWPVHPLGALAGSLVVATVAAGWVAALMLTGPALGAVDWMGRIVRISEGI